MAMQVAEERQAFYDSYDCSGGENCLMKRHMVDFAPYNELIPGYNGFSDIDGVVDLDGKILFLEFKRGNAPLRGLQEILHKNLSRKGGQCSLIVWRDDEGVPSRCQWITNGEVGDPIEFLNGEQDLKTVIHTWRAV